MQRNKLFIFLLSAVIFVNCQVEHSIVYLEENISFTEDVFWVQDTSSQTSGKSIWYNIVAQKKAESENCIVYVQKGVKDSKGREISAQTASDVSWVFEEHVFDSITGAFGNVVDIDDNGKVILLLLDIRDRYGGFGSYIGGYFDSTHMRTGRFSNRADMLFLDVNPGTPGTMAFNATLAHEFQHLINYSATVAKGKPEKEIWINEGLSQGAEYILSQKMGGSGDPNNRIAYFNIDPTGSIAYGNNFFVWRGKWEGYNVPSDKNISANFRDDIANYATAYTFFQWLRIHSIKDDGNGHSTTGLEIYKDIIDSAYTDYRAVTTAAAARIDSQFAYWSILLRTWYAAGAYNRTTDYLGYRGLIALAPRFLSGISVWPLSPGEGVFSRNTDEFYPYEEGRDIFYCGLGRSGNLSLYTPFTGSYILTYNASTSNTSPEESGYLTGQPAAQNINMRAVSNGDDDFWLPSSSADALENPKYFPSTPVDTLLPEYSGE